MSDHFYVFPSLSPSSLVSFPYASILQSKDGLTFLLRRQDADEYPNLFVTKDFRSFTQLTNIQPQSTYNWMSSEPISYKDTRGKSYQAIVYKPENFDPAKKYPVIFTLYERQSDGLHLYEHPDLSSGVLNIPYFVSHGYVVVAPDIYYTTGEPGQSAFRAVNAVANYMAKRPWVDANKMALHGHSFGGYEVNYLLTRTKRFAAAVEAAGLCDMVSMYNDLRLAQGIPHHFYFETNQGRLGATLWQRPERYIKNSPLFNAPSVATPLLIMHNEGDQQVAWSQGVEWFNALRRLGKQSWMLQYKGEGHSLQQDNNKLNYTGKMMQFFDHYLKDAPAPDWIK
jgi:dipeptidyl aminopeptidase/acylaminoacyl peptidase